MIRNCKFRMAVRLIYGKYGIAVQYSSTSPHQHITTRPSTHKPTRWAGPALQRTCQQGRAGIHKSPHQHISTSAPALQRTSQTRSGRLALRRAVRRRSGTTRPPPWPSPIAVAKASGPARSPSKASLPARPSASETAPVPA